jgi:hypothetical protein
MENTDDIYSSILKTQEEKLNRFAALLPYTDCNTMPDNHESFQLNLSPEQQSVVLMELRNDLRDIKNALGPIAEWKSKMQGAMFAIGFALTMIVGSGGFLTWRWWDANVEIASMKFQMENQKEKNTVLENQISIARSNAEATSQTIAPITNELKDYNKDLADIKSRISSLETGAITKHVGR